MSRLYGYARVSTKKQSLDVQVAELLAFNAGMDVDHIKTEKISGSLSLKDRPVFDSLVNTELRDGDSLIVTKIDRLGRNMLEIMKVIQLLKEKQVKVICIELGEMDLNSMAGKMIVAVLSVVAEAERERILERTQAGREAAMDKGVKFGGSKSKIDLTELAKLHASGKTQSQMAKLLGVTDRTIRRQILKLDSLEQTELSV